MKLTETIEDYEDEFKLSNRQRSKQANKEKFWCYTCDYFYGGELGKCPVCGCKGNAKKINYDRKRTSFNT